MFKSTFSPVTYFSLSVLLFLFPGCEETKQPPPSEQPTTQEESTPHDPSATVDDEVDPALVETVERMQAQLPDDDQPATVEMGEPLDSLRPLTPEELSDLPSESSAPPPDPDTLLDQMAEAEAWYDRLLSEIVSDEGLVRYQVLSVAHRRSILQSIVDRYAAAQLPESENERLAFWCNVYNANVLNKVIAARRLGEFVSVSAVDGFFDRDTITVAGETLTLNDLENNRIRPLSDARIHAALVCGAMSCPPLLDEPFTSDFLDHQLDYQCRRWIDDTTKNTVRDGKPALSQIFEWNESDFDADPFDSIAGFIERYAIADSELATLLKEHPDAEITYLEYDWSLNQVPGDENPEK